MHAKDNMDSMRRWTSGWGAVPGEEAVEAEEDSVGASERKWYFDNNRKKVAWSLLSQPPVDPPALSIFRSNANMMDGRELGRLLLVLDIFRLLPWVRTCLDGGVLKLDPSRRTMDGSVSQCWHLY